MNDNKSSKSKLDATKTTKINFDENCFACFECSTIQYIQHLQQNDKQQVRHLQQTEQQSQNLQQHVQHSQHHCNDHLQHCVIHNNSCTHTHCDRNIFADKLLLDAILLPQLPSFLPEIHPDWCHTQRKQTQTGYNLTQQQTARTNMNHKPNTSTASANGTDIENLVTGDLDLQVEQQQTTTKEKDETV